MLGSNREAPQGALLPLFDHTCEGVRESDRGGDEAAAELVAALALHREAHVAGVLKQMVEAL
jgi:hypothetical protein